MRSYLLKNSFHIFQLFIFEPKYCQTKLLYHKITVFIIRFLSLVIGSIQFNNQILFCAIEIGDKKEFLSVTLFINNRFLTKKSVPVKLPLPQIFP